jgi:type VI secretion system protein VasJ
MDLLSLGKTPISDDQPTGTDVRYEPEFETLQAEIDKLSSPSASGGIDWDKVNTLSSEILSSKAKDLLVASYLAVAQLHTRQIEGFSVGLRVYIDLLELYWDGLFPAKKRMRGRVAAIEWWLEKSEAALQLFDVDPLPAEKIEGYRQDIQHIDKLFSEYLEDAPLLRPLERFVDNIPVAAEKKPEPEAPPPAEGAPETGAEPKPEVRPEPGTEVRPEPKPMPAPPPVAGDVASSSDAEKVLRDSLQAIRGVAEFFHNQDLSDARAYRWRRIAGWAMIQSLPPATDGRTQIPPPLQYETVQSALKGLKDKGNWEALLRAAEERFQGALLWLDLNRFSAEALTGLGDSYQDAHDAICRETAYLVHRIPGVESLSFLDGTPFCDVETQQWLKGIRLGTGAGMVEPVVGEGAGEGDHMAETILKAQALAKNKEVGKAVSILQKELRNSYSKREQLLWRLGLSQILLSAKKPQLALPQLESVLHDIDDYRLEEWEPNLALKGLKVVWQGFGALSDESIKTQATDVLNRIAKLDPAEALMFTKS